MVSGNKPGAVIARSIFGDEAISAILNGDCELIKQASTKNASQ